MMAGLTFQLVVSPYVSPTPPRKQQQKRSWSSSSSSSLSTTTQNKFPCALLIIRKRSQPSLFSSSSSPRSRNILARGGDDDLFVVRAVKEVVVPEGLQPGPMPKHVAVVMDGNKRWADERGLPSLFGHKAGKESLDKMAQLCQDWGIKVLTVFAFSTENWKRSQEEISYLMRLAEQEMKSQLYNLQRNEGTRISVIGDLSELPKSMQKVIQKLEDATKGYSEFHLILAGNYSGKYDMKQACKRIIQETKDGLLEIQDITPKHVEDRLLTSITELPYPDLFIRSSGELRLSNFMLWQLAHTQLYFTDTLWPDFGELEFVEAIKSFQQSKASMSPKKHNN